jgi:hypothetical protein
MRNFKTAHYHRLKWIGELVDEIERFRQELQRVQQAMEEMEAEESESVTENSPLPSSRSAPDHPMLAAKNNRRGACSSAVQWHHPWPFHRRHCRPRSA